MLEKEHDVIDGKIVPLLRCISVDSFEESHFLLRTNMVFFRIMD